MLALNRSLLNTVINVLKALASIIYTCNLHVILLSKITPRYFTLFTIISHQKGLKLHYSKMDVLRSDRLPI
jgi:hypothetical protein